jgi:hypothetical protein
MLRLAVWLRFGLRLGLGLKSDVMNINCRHGFRQLAEEENNNNSKNVSKTFKKNIA